MSPMDGQSPGPEAFVNPGGCVKRLLVRFQYSHPFSAGSFANVRTKGPLGARDSVVAGQEIGVSLNRKRAPYQEALHFVASLFDQDFQLVVGFNTFGQRGQSQPVRETDDGAHDSKRPSRAAQRRDERSVDLDSIERKGLKVGQ